MEIETPVSATNLHTVAQTSLGTKNNNKNTRVEDFELASSQASSNSSTTSYGGLRTRNGRTSKQTVTSNDNNHRVKFESETGNYTHLNGNGTKNQASNESDNDSTDSVISSDQASSNMKTATKTNTSNYENLSANSITNNTKSSKLEKEQQQRMTRKSLQLLNNKTSNCIQNSNTPSSQPTVLINPCSETSPTKLTSSHNNVNNKIKDLKTAVKNGSSVNTEDDNALDGFTKDENNFELPSNPVKSTIKIEKISKSEKSDSAATEENRSNVVFSVDNEDEDVDMTLDDSVPCPLNSNNNNNTNMDSLLNDENSNTNQNNDETSQQVNTDSNMEPVGGATGAKRGRKKKSRRTNLMVNGQFNE
jgi:hypothetical protein